MFPSSEYNIVRPAKEQVPNVKSGTSPKESIDIPDDLRILIFFTVRSIYDGVGRPDQIHNPSLSL